MIVEKNYKFIFLYRTLTQRIPTGKEDIVIVHTRERSSGRMPIRSLEGFFYCNKSPVEGWNIGRIIARDNMTDLEKEYEGKFVPFRN